MFYTCTITNGKGEFVKEFSPQEISAKHWGTKPICLGCGKSFSEISKGQPRGVSYANSAGHRPGIMSPGIPPRDLLYCTYSCKSASRQKERLANIPMEPMPCEVCGKDMKTRNKRRRFCPGECRKRGAAVFRKPEWRKYIKKGDR